MEGIINYAANGYAPYWMKKGAVVAWFPNSRWDAPPRNTVDPKWFENGEADWNL